MKKFFWLIVMVLIILAVVVFILWTQIFKTNQVQKTANSFEECVALGQPVREIYPRQCQSGDKTFTEDIGNELEKADLIKVSSPRPNQSVSSPLVITGEARGNWFFEASFPVQLLDENKNVLASGVAQAQGDWMTTDFVPFTATLEFTSTATEGRLILKKDNPSGLAEHDDQLEVPVSF